ncbi:hypothetical protein [Microbacterium sp. VKM Ac-2923]|uniref:hypothetical protein n=1 Tax=Microbacterium sp. VKM Ac-2923 TaxID=2929476 RepID=UPI001FB258E6|nr:hypothetical protein [Microbacterium sp. VKM Ac-2923]MCJ1709083.1 hypothetical protein [Microbacterium sp. VKM Ac-2923]
MPHIELRDLRDEDRDAAFSASRAGDSAWPRTVFHDRRSFDDWTDQGDVVAHAIVQDGVVIGVAAAMEVDDDREIMLAVSPDADAEASTNALRLLTTREAERPLYACIAGSDQPSHDVLARIGFVEHRRDGGDVVYVLPPTLE